MSLNTIMAKARSTGKTQLTIDSIKQFMETLHKPYTEKRELVVMTGRGGMDRINLEMEKGNDRDFADFLLNNNHITTEERDRLHQMINATHEDYEVARSILANLSEVHTLCYKIKFV